MVCQNHLGEANANCHLNILECTRKAYPEDLGSALDVSFVAGALEFC